MARFNPHKRYHGIYIPDGVYGEKSLTPNSKLIYGRLLRYAGSDGAAFPKQETIAEELGISLSSVQNGIKLLVKVGLIEVEKRNKMYHESDKYHFLESTILGTSKSYVSEEVKSTSRGQVKVTCRDTQKLGIVHEESHLKENQLKESSPLPQESEQKEQMHPIEIHTSEEEELYRWLEKKLSMCSEKDLREIIQYHGKQGIKSIWEQFVKDHNAGKVKSVGAFHSRLKKFSRGETGATVKPKPRKRKDSGFSAKVDAYKKKAIPQGGMAEVMKKIDLTWMNNG